MGILQTALPTWTIIIPRENTANVYQSSELMFSKLEADVVDALYRIESPSLPRVSGGGFLWMTCGALRTQRPRKQTAYAHTIYEKRERRNLTRSVTLQILLPFSWQQDVHHSWIFFILKIRVPLQKHAKLWEYQFKKKNNFTEFQSPSFKKMMAQLT